ncbi:MAG: zinc-ribbon domain-containing protein [Methanomassiliicoccales archaeon]|nr:zinc-ribbon domain-containing protein [Methanomassiliicoccales archaeon]
MLVKPLASKCAKCQTELDSGDMFCAKCGAKVERDIRCPRCSNSVQVDDAYCRKCGLPLRSD